MGVNDIKKFARPTGGTPTELIYSIIIFYLFFVVLISTSIIYFPQELQPGFELTT